jgi:hypothetical protein
MLSKAAASTSVDVAALYFALYGKKALEPSRNVFNFKKLLESSIPSALYLVA